MRATERVTITLPTGLLAHVARLEHNRSRFIAEAVAREVKRRRRRELLRSLAAPHPEAVEVAEEGMEGWLDARPAAEADLVDVAGGTAVRWHPDRGWEAVER